MLHAIRKTDEPSDNKLSEAKKEQKPALLI